MIEAPLLGVAEAEVPQGGEAVFVTAPDGIRLRVASFPPKGPVRGSVILSPGRTEYVEKYFEVVEELTGRGFATLVHDWRGQGLSDRLVEDPLKGHARGWRPFVHDYERLLTLFEPRLPRPWIGLGHSMGGGLLALSLAEGETRLDAAAFSAPMLGLRFADRSKAEVEAACFAMNFVGRAKTYVQKASDPLNEAFDATALTHDEGRWRRIRAQILAHPELRLGAITWGWLSMALTLCARVSASRRIEALKIPVLVALAEEDRLLVNDPAAAFARRAPKGRSLLVAGARHEILMETDPIRGAFWSAFDAFLEEAAPAPSRRGGRKASTGGGARKPPRAAATRRGTGSPEEA